MRPERRNGKGGCDAAAAPKHMDSDPSEVNLLRAKFGLDKGVHLRLSDDPGSRGARMWKMKSILLIVLLIASCDRAASSFADRYTDGALLNRRHQMLTAPIIFVGVVEAVQLVGKPKPALSVQGLTLQLYRARGH